MGLFKRKPNPATAEAVKPQSIPRPARVRLTSLHSIHFRLLEGDHKHQLVNISTGGMALKQDEFASWRRDEAISGLLLIGGEDFTISARVKHLTNLIAGCEFIDVPMAFRRTIENYLRIEILGLSLRPIEVAYIQPDPRGSVAWFVDGQMNEIYCVSDDQGVVTFHATFLGIYVEGGRQQSIRMGTVLSEETTTPGHKSADMVDFGRPMDAGVLKMARSFVQNAERMPLWLREEIDHFLNPDK